MENQQKSREPDDSEIGLDSFAAMNHPGRQIISQITERQNAIYDKDDGYLADMNSPVDSAEDGQDLGLERGTYISENKNDAKCSSEHDSSDEEPLLAPDILNVRKDTRNDFMENRDITFGFSMVGDSIPHFFRPRPAPIHSTPLVCKHRGNQSLYHPEEAVEDDEYWRKNAQPSYLDDERTLSQREEERSQTISRMSPWLIIQALVFTFFTTLFIILLFDYLNAE